MILAFVVPSCKPLIVAFDVLLPSVILEIDVSVISYETFTSSAFGLTTAVKGFS